MDPPPTTGKLTLPGASPHTRPSPEGEEPRLRGCPLRALRPNVLRLLPTPSALTPAGEPQPRDRGAEEKERCGLRRDYGGV